MASFIVATSDPSHELRKLKALSIKVKTGCMTCRIRKIKCDEGKPSCQRCLKTGRSCDGYESTFRPYGKVAKQVSPISTIVPPPARLVMGLEIMPQEISSLSHLFSTKPETEFSKRYEKEAREILRARMTEPAIRHAVVSLESLRQEYEQNDSLLRGERCTPTYFRGIQEYNKAIAKLAQRLSVPSPETLRAALLCCQIFISIEVMQSNYEITVQHLIRGLRIMYDYRTRPSVGSDGKFLPAGLPDMPNIDLFVIKLLAPPCAQAFHFYASSSEQKTHDGIATPFEFAMRSPVPSPERQFIFQHRTTLVALACSIAKLLARIPHTRTSTEALLLVNEKQILLDQLQDWFNQVKYLHFSDSRDDADSPLEQFTHPGIAYLFFFYAILKIIMQLALTSSKTVLDELHPEFSMIEDIAKYMTHFARTNNNAR
ncbi:hypothetical protein BP5796_13059 [Coleophoma crateriformis]|uniref:Zn(2)-C6 fungal-type domain-containing protein n=1 Tax=Coleophoma crateriformis TaxID=565419 RepID=A0A3D8Q5B0_9HELO|nr:hypothetical protein BP5796_13059 [Coleophoma crateriformis]